MDESSNLNIFSIGIAKEQVPVREGKLGEGRRNRGDSVYSLLFFWLSSSVTRMSALVKPFKQVKKKCTVFIKNKSLTCISMLHIKFCNILKYR